MFNTLGMNNTLFVGRSFARYISWSGQLIFFFLLLAIACNSNAQGAASYENADWVNVGQHFTVKADAPVTSRRSPDATVKITITNKSAAVIKGPVRFILKDLTAGVSLKSPAGTSASGPYLFVLDNPEQSLAAGAQKILELTILGGGSKIFSISPLLEQAQLGCSNGATNYPACNNNGLAVVITEPKSLVTIGHSPLTVRGTINRPGAILVVNGNRVAHAGGKFEAQVTVEEGYNTIVASATEGIEQVTDNISVSLDLTPPYVTIESHTDGQKVSTNKITVTGLVNDIVRGTVEAEQAQVRVNGIAAQVSNRSYAAKDIPLQEGPNQIKIAAADQVGNTETKIITVIYEKPEDKQIVLVSGQDQSAPINSVLANPLVVKLVKADGTPVANETVVFRVMQDSGEVAADTAKEGRAVIVQTNTQGVASTKFRVGLRTGIANNKVKAAAVGYQGEVIFNASATTKIGNKLSVNSGNNQRGVVNQVLPAPLVAVVTDEGANVVKGARVRFEAIKGSGVFENKESSIQAVTDSDGRATVRFFLGDLEGLDAQHVRATLIDAPEGQEIVAGFNATGFVQADPGLTTVSGVVLDNQDNPIPGITMHIEGTTRKALTNDQGRFIITSAPVGPIHLVADGSTASVAGEFPNLGYRLVTISGVDNPLPSPIYMVKLNTKEAVYAGKEDVALTLEKYPGFKLEIAKNSVTFPDGAREGYISVTAVNAAAVPMAPPNGMQPQFIVTIQPTGTRFDAPARLSLPNVDGHAPGAQVEMYSYDHDLEEFVAIGLGTVTEDGTTIRSNPGVGVVKAGWHCGSQPGGSGTAANCATCYKCDGSTCVKDPGQNNSPLPQQTAGDCKTATCGGSKNDDSDKPEDDCGKCENGKAVLDKEKELPKEKQQPDDCKALMCDGASKPADETAELKKTKPCKFCSGGDVKWEKDESACSDGTPQQACYTCRDGECGNHCTAQHDPPTTQKGGLAAAKLDGLLKSVFDGISKSPVINASFSGVKLEGEVETGKECCADCTEGPTPKNYAKYTGAVQAEISLTAAVPGAGVALRMPKQNFGDIVVSGTVEAGLGGRGSAGVSGSASYKDTDCKTGSECVEASLGAKGSFGVGLLGTVQGKVESCNVKFDGWKQGSPSYEFKDCSELFATGAKLEALATASVFATAKSYFGEKCTNGSCYTYGYDGLVFEPIAEFSITLGGIFQTSVSQKVSIKLADGDSGGTCN